MFRLYDRTRRRISIALFGLLCVAPTLLVLAWCVAWQLPSHLQAEKQRLNRELGMDVSLDGLRHLRPGEVVYEGLRLTDPETGQTVFRCRKLEATWTETKDCDRTDCAIRPSSGDGSGNPSYSPTRPAIVLVASQAEFEAAASGRIGQLLQRILHGEAGRPEIEVRLRAAEATVRAGEQSQTLTDLQGSIEVIPGGIQAQAAFRMNSGDPQRGAGVSPAPPVRIRLVRNRQVTPPTNALQLDTGGSEVPCGLLAMGLPDLRSLGPASRFRGELSATETSIGWEGGVRGQWLGLDLQGLVDEQFPHKLSGMGNLTVQRARFRAGRLEEAEGTFSAGPGKISRSLVLAAIQQLGLVRAAEPSGTGDRLPYGQLAVSFHLNSRGLTIRGGCAGSGPGTVLSDHQIRILGEPAVQPQPVVALIRTLVPASELQVPATLQSGWLTRHLPVPDIVAAPPSPALPQ